MHIIVMSSLGSYILDIDTFDLYMIFLYVS